MRKLAVLAWTLTAACTLSACGAQAGPPTTSAAAPTSTTPAAFTDINNLVGAITAQSATKHSAHFTITGSEAQQNLSGSGDLRQDTSGIALNMTMTTTDGQTEMIVLGNAIYMKMPPGSEVEPGKPWVKITADGNDPLSKVLGAVVKVMQQSADISKSLDNMKAAGTLTKSAQEKLDGTDVTHYWITVDMAKLAQSLADPTLKDAMLKAVASGAKTTNEEAWVTKDNLPVKFTVEVPGANGAKTSVTATYSDWGKPVNITAPPANEVGTLPTLGG